MGEGIKLSFKEIISSEAYQKQATSWCKNHIFTGLIVAVATVWFGSVSLGLHWLWVFPVLLFGISLVVSLPTMAVLVWLVTVQSSHMKFAFGIPPPADAVGKFLNIAKTIWSIASCALAGYASYLFVNYVGR
jgi:hypothetical protein